MHLSITNLCRSALVCASCSSLGGVTSEVRRERSIAVTHWYRHALMLRCNTKQYSFLTKLLFSFLCKTCRKPHGRLYNRNSKSGRPDLVPVVWSPVEEYNLLLFGKRTVLLGGDIHKLFFLQK